MACDRPCDTCPWRVANQGKSHPEKWYTKRNLRRLWARLRRGESMSCHRTDPDVIQAPGAKPVPDEMKTRECVGGAILQQREFMRIQRMLDQSGASAIKAYTLAHPNGLTKVGAQAVVERHILGGTTLGVSNLECDLNEEGIGYERLHAWAIDTEGVSDGQKV